MTLLTSHSSPLNIQAVWCPMGNGRIGMTICPGKHQANALSGHFQRDLQLDLDLIKSWEAAAVVSLMADEELSSLGADQLGAGVESRGMLWFQLPIADQGMPNEDFERRWVYAGLRLRELLRAGKSVLVHCRSGLGRTGLISARLLVELGMPLDQALLKVREARPGTLQALEQVQYLQGFREAGNDAWLDRVLGCLLGGAVGDAFGYAVEFDSLASIHQRFGPKGITQPVYQQGRLVVSDDTQMTLFTLEGILRCTSETGEVSTPGLLEEIRNAYLDWYDTQQNESSGTLYGSLAERTALRVRRAPGNTCLSALKAGGHGSIEKRINDSKGCGGVMRTAPIGFLQDIDLFDFGARSAALTHGHVEGWAPSGILPRIVSRLIQGEKKFLAVRNGFWDAGEWGYFYGEAAGTDYYLLARKLASKMRYNPYEAIRLIGQGWVGDEALAVGMYAFLSARDYSDAVVRASNHDGDSDSTASIAGQLWGAMHGVRDIPNDWIRRLDVLDEILHLVQRMQGWQRQVHPIDLRQLVVPEHVQPCVRMIEMAHELHVLGYQKIRIFPSMAPSGCYWRLDFAPADAFGSATEPPSQYNERLIARYSSGSEWQPFGWQSVQELSAEELAQQFLRQFPELCRAGEGDDWAYAGWLTRLLGEVRKGRLPYMAADWPMDCTRGVPMIDGEHFPVPPEVETINENPEDDELYEERDGRVDERCERLVDEECVTTAPGADDCTVPEPGDFDFTDIYSRTHGLVALYHQGESYLLQVTQTIWQLLPEPREACAQKLCALMGHHGTGKLGIHKLLEDYLIVADKACEVAAATTDENWAIEGGLDWDKVGQTFAEMDKALLETAFELSKRVEQVICSEAV